MKAIQGSNDVSTPKSKPGLDESICGSNAVEKAMTTILAGLAHSIQEPQSITLPNNGPTDLAVTSGTSPPREISTDSHRARTCRTCKTSKALDNFHVKRCDYETECKVCKKTKRKARSKNIPTRTEQGLCIVTNQKSTKSARRDEKLDQKRTPAKSPYIEPRSELSFSIWERRYGRPLTEFEKFDIKTNLTSFFVELMHATKGTVG